MGTLISENELLLKSWDYKKNNVRPDQVNVNSHKKYWWICENGHSYEQVSYSKVKGIGCPYCSGKLAVKGENDLITTHPDLAKEWDYTKNNVCGYDIEKLPLGSQIKVWWICKNGHSFQRSIYDRLHKRGSCPYCTNKKLLEGYNDFATTNPELLKEWNYKKNDELGIKPNGITNGGRQKVWWICENGHEWDSIIRTRIKGSGCPYCSNNKILKGYNDITTTNPEILKYWNYEKNHDLKPTNYSHGSTKQVWWICEKGHEWKSSVSNISRGSGCPYCSGLKAIKGETDFATKHPTLMKEWNYEKNEKMGIKPEEIIGTGKIKVWWKCDKGHEWQSSVASRIRGKNLYHACPVCMSYRKISFPEKIIYFYLKKIYPNTKANYKPEWLNNKELDIYIPERKIGIEYDGSYYHKEHERDIIKDKLCEENGIKLIRIREKKCKNIESTSIIFNLTEDNKSDGSHIKSGIEFLEEFLNIYLDYDLQRDTESILELINFIEKENCIKNSNPEVLKEWNYDKNNAIGITPENISYGSAIKVWWICDKGHEYKATISTKISQNTGCPYCSNKIVLSGFNDIAITNPELLKEWDYDKNNIEPTKVSKGYGKKVWWICERGHSYDSLIINKVKGDGCPYCSGHRVLKGFNDIATMYPNLKSEWDYEKNSKLGLFMENFTKGNATKVWWICSKGHEYETSINGKTSKNTNCPYCSGQKVLKGFNDIATTNPELLKEWDYDKNTIQPDTISKGSRYKIWWLCNLGHSYNASIPNRLKGTGCPYCSGNKVLKGFNDIATTNPELLKKWNYDKNEKLGITPYSISKSYSKKVWWTCDKGHDYQREVYNERKGSGKCPICRKTKQL